MYACDGPVVARRPAEVPDMPGYGDELRALELNPPMPPEPRPYTGSGSYPRWSPDGTVAAVTTEARGNAQTVNIWDARTEHLRPLISIAEFDPGSGRAYRYAWSRDGKALLIYGHGRLADGDQSETVPDDRMRLCLVYELQRDTLYRISPCQRVKWAFG
jgi:hypothetical protein